jgi:AraC-like DNA-binding protein
MDFVGFLFGFGLLQGLILAGVLLFARSGHRLANLFMSGLVVAIALSLLQNWLVRVGYFFDHPSTGLLIPPLDFLWGPLLFLYAYSLTNRSVHWRQALHFVPSLFLLANSANFVLYSQEEQSAILSYIWSQHTDTALEQQVASTVPAVWRLWIDYHLQGSLFALHFGTYCALVLRQIRQHNQRMQRHFSSLEHMNLRWLRALALTCLFFLLVFLTFNRSQLIIVGHFDVNALIPNIPYLFLVVLIYIAGVAAIFQPNLITGVNAALDSDPNTQSDLPNPSSDPAPAPATEVEIHDLPEPVKESTPSVAEHRTEEEKPNKYERSGLSIEDAERYKILLMQKMQEEELYLDCELTLPELAQKTGLTPHQVSQVLNGQMNQNFFSFVNNYRIQLAKTLLSTPETRNMPVVELAVEVGFKSKSSFYDAFKKATQMTPTQFKKSVDQP